MYFRAVCSLRTGQSVNCHIALKAMFYLLNEATAINRHRNVVWEECIWYPAFPERGVSLNLNQGISLILGLVLITSLLTTVRSRADIQLEVYEVNTITRQVKEQWEYTAKNKILIILNRICVSMCIVVPVLVVRISTVVKGQSSQD